MCRFGYFCISLFHSVWRRRPHPSANLGLAAPDNFQWKYIRFSGNVNDCRMASMGKRFEIDQNALHHCFSDVILDRNTWYDLCCCTLVINNSMNSTRYDIGMWLFSVHTRLFSLPHSCCRWKGVPILFFAALRKLQQFLQLLWCSIDSKLSKDEMCTRI